VIQKDAVPKNVIRKITVGTMAMNIMDRQIGQALTTGMPPVLTRNFTGEPTAIDGF